MTSTTRRSQRVRIIETLYQLDLGALETLETSGMPFVDEVLLGVQEHLSEIDEVISSSLVSYTIKRLSFVDRAIVRLAVYELMFTQTPAEIIIDEALELTHQYTDLGDQKSVAFNNRLLDNISKALKEGPSGD